MLYASVTVLYLAKLRVRWYIISLWLLLFVCYQFSYNITLIITVIREIYMQITVLYYMYMLSRYQTKSASYWSRRCQLNRRCMHMCVCVRVSLSSPSRLECQSRNIVCCVYESQFSAVLVAYTNTLHAQWLVQTQHISDTPYYSTTWNLW